MTSAQYSLLRYTPDPARNEPLNLGVIVWTHSRFRLRIDASAAERIIRENPFLSKDALLSLEGHLREELAAAVGSTEDRMLEAICQQSRFPLLFSDALLTYVEADGDEGLDEATDRLVTRLLTVRRRWGGSSKSPAQVLEQALRPLLRSRRVEKNHAFDRSATGVTRMAEFYVNHGANVAVDTLQLNLKSADEAFLRLDAEAFKVRDVLQRNSLTYLVYCELPTDSETSIVNDRVDLILNSAGAQVARDIEVVTEEVTKAAMARI
jgi:hypothetical protein